MRIKPGPRPEASGFWAETRGWLASRRGAAQFALALAMGIALSLGAAVWYVRQGRAFAGRAFQALDNQVQDLVASAIVDNDLPTLRLDIGFEEFQAIARLRDEALQSGILLQDDEDWHAAQIRFEGETIPVRVRLKGDWVDHLHEGKWSFRVKTRNDQAFMGMRSFSLQAPYTRRYLNEWLYLEDLRRSGILGPRYGFVNVFVNGDHWGIYALEESFSKELLESQSRREGVIVRYDESLFWSRRALFYDGENHWSLELDPIATTFETRGFSSVDEFNTAEVQANPVLQEQSATALALLRAFQEDVLTVTQVFDANLIARYVAHNNLWGARHGMAWHNERYYYNPLTSRLEPIAYDGMPLGALEARYFDLAQYDDLEVMRAYVQEVARISQPQYLADLRWDYEEQFRRYAAALREEFDPVELEAPWDVLAERQRLLRGVLHPPQAVYAHQVSDGQDGAIDILVGNLLHYAVRLESLQVGDRRVQIDPGWVSAQDQDLLHLEAADGVVLRRAAEATPEYVTLQVPRAALGPLFPTDAAPYTGTLQIVTSLYGVDEPIVTDVRRDYPEVATRRLTPKQPTVEEALARHPFLAPAEEPGFLELREGAWHVDGDLVLPDGVGLWATQETTLFFDPGAILFATGPLLLSGPESGASMAQGIRLLPWDDHWAGVFVLHAGEETPSVLRHVEIRGTSGIERGGWVTTGGVTFYESPVRLESCRLHGSLAEDTINVVRARFQFSDSEFADAASDAFDGDFVTGRIERCAFHDVRGDAVDVSGSQVVVSGVTLLRVYDKGLSVGEDSALDAQDVYAEDVGMALVSKDLSRLSARNVRIARAWTAGLAAYLKKLEYGPAHIEASEVVFEDGSVRTLVQSGSTVALDGETDYGTALDVDALYARQEAVAAMTELRYELGDAIRLLGYEVVTSTLAPGDDLELVLYWQAMANVEHDYSVFVHVLDQGGRLVAQGDSMPRGNVYPTGHWQVGPLVDDPRSIALPLDLPPGEYRVVVGMYDLDTGERLPAREVATGQAAPNAAIVLDEVIHVQAVPDD
ncbi:MAG: CotH kinase family protein [Anaerolineae bacterium]|nr:CotH kinase family protein [Anaerolineae bacterium]